MSMRRLLFAFFVCFTSLTAFAAGQDPVTPVLLALFIVFLGAKLGGYLIAKLGQPAVLGELLFGIIIGNLTYVGYDGLDYIKQDVVFEILSGIGVVLLLFEVGLESNIDDLLKVGLVSLVVALTGVIAPMFLGFYVGEWLLPEASQYAHIFLGATLAATSVGITARVLKDIGKSHTREAKIILGAAVIDDVLGLIVLAVVTALIHSVNQSGGDATGVDLAAVATISLKAVGFLLIALVLGIRAAPFVFRIGAKIKIEGMLLATTLCVCFFLAFLSAQFGLAPIIGAFAAGLIIDASGFEKFFEHDESKIEDLLLPISGFFVPIFFVTMGMRVDLGVFFNIEVLTLATAITVAAILGKQLCSLAVFSKGLNRFAIGIGMIPRGEVGLIFASIGSQLYINGQRVIDDVLFSAIVAMVAITTVMTPLALKFAMNMKPSGRV
jgi:Kef-type K+ transport system membrane component KefB